MVYYFTKITEQNVYILIIWPNICPLKSQDKWLYKGKQDKLTVEERLCQYLTTALYVPSSSNLEKTFGKCDWELLMFAQFLQVSTLAEQGTQEPWGQIWIWTTFSLVFMMGGGGGAHRAKTVLKILFFKKKLSRYVAGLH